MAEMKKDLQGSNTIAQMFGVTERRVQQLAKEGVIPVEQKKPYRFDLIPTVRAYVQYLTEKAYGKEEKSADTKTAEADKLRADADFKRSKADMAGLQLKELEGKMHRSEDVEAMVTDLVFTIRSMIMALPGRLAMDVAQITDAAEASELIRSECHKILNELAGYQYDPEAYQRRVRDREGWGTQLDDETDE